MTKSPEVLGAALHAALGEFLTVELPLLKKDLGLDARAPHEQALAEREVTAFCALCVAQTLAQVIADAERRRAILIRFFQNAAGEENFNDFMARLEPTFRAYERAIRSGNPSEAAYKAAIELYDRLFPGKAYDVGQVDRLKSLVPEIGSVCRKAYAKP